MLTTLGHWGLGTKWGVHQIPNLRSPQDCWTELKHSPVRETNLPQHGDPPCLLAAQKRGMQVDCTQSFINLTSILCCLQKRTADWRDVPDTIHSGEKSFHFPNACSDEEKPVLRGHSESVLISSVTGIGLNSQIRSGTARSMKRLRPFPKARSGSWSSEVCHCLCQKQPLEPLHRTTAPTTASVGVLKFSCRSS